MKRDTPTEKAYIQLKSKICKRFTYKLIDKTFGRLNSNTNTILGLQYISDSVSKRNKKRMKLTFY